MIFNEIKSKDDIYTFFNERGINPVSEDINLLKIDKRHFLRIMIEADLSRSIASEMKKRFSGKEEFMEYLLIIKSDFSLFVFKKLYGDTDTVIYDKLKKYSRDTELSLLKKINLLKYENSETNNLFHQLFDVREVVDKFYNDYKKLRDNLANSIVGTSESELLSQIILGRLIFIYFLQVKGIIRKNYLAVLFFKMQEGENYYLNYLEPIFFELFNKEVEFRDPEINKKFPEIPYLNGGLFSKFEGIEILGNRSLKIEINNDVWKGIFTLFDSYGWIIEEKRGDSISVTPSVLGHIYEKSVVQRDTGSYYTPKEITNYISKNTIYPQLTRNLNNRCNTTYNDINDLLDTKTHSKEELEYISILYFEFVKKITICDPACGSGAFLIAAEYVLFDLYKRCITVIQDSEYFREELEEIDKHVSLNYYIIKKIITNNIFGVDIQKGCVEITKLRLWLSMISETVVNSRQIESLPNIGYNIRVGNSLIGFTKIPKRKKWDTLDWRASEDELDKLSELKNEFRKTKSSRRAVQIRHLVSEKSEKIMEQLNSVYCNNKQILIEDKITVTRGMLKSSIIEEIQKMNYNYELNKFKINLKTKNTINVEKIRAVSGITCYARNGKVSSIYPSQSFDFKKHKEGKANPLSSILTSLIDRWDEVKEIEFERLFNPDDLLKLGYFHWIIEFYDVFEKGGFDIIIGNPPYIRQERINDMTNGIDYKLILGKVYRRLVKNEAEKNLDNMDLSVYFILRSYMIVKNKGYHSFIITNKWLRAAYGLSVRHFLKNKTQIIKFIDFIKIDVFQGLTVDTVLYILRKNMNIENLISFCLPISIDEFIINDHDYHCKQTLLEDDLWSFSDPLTVELKTHIDLNGIQLKEMGVKIYRGITTGFNDAFLIKSELRNNLISKNPEYREIFKPILKGKNITRYNINWNDFWLIKLENGSSKRLGINDEKSFRSKMPDLYNHFQKFFNAKGKGKGLKNRDDQGEFWWELRSCDYYKEFEKSKIVSTKAAKEPSFSLDFRNYYILNTSYVIASDSKVLLAILNSNLCRFYIQEFMSKLKYGSTGTYEPKVEELEKFPMITSKKSFDIVDYLLINKDSFENIVNCLVYELYFNEKFHADGLYPEVKFYLYVALEKHLKPLQYEEWSKLDWKQETGEITKKKRDRLGNLFVENSQIVEDLITILNKDPEIKKWMDIIKSHEWVIKIEDKLND